MSEAEKSQSFSKPTRSRPDTSDITFDPNDTAGLLSWEWVRERVVATHNYWLASTSPEGRPHVMPIWCAWYNETLYFRTGRESRKYQNLVANPEAVIHLESGSEVVIFEGRVEEIPADPATFAPLADAYAAKYPGFRPEINPDSIYYRLVPSTVTAWDETNFLASTTLWTY